MRALAGDLDIRIAAIGDLGAVGRAGASRLVRNGVALAYDDTGRGGPPLVFVHGIACHRGFWAPQVAHFVRRHRVLAVDLRGHGGSDAPRQRYTMRSFADDLMWTCAQLEISRPVVVGHSLGGLVAIEAAAGYPDKLRAAVLIDSVLLSGGDRTDAVHELIAGLRSQYSERTLREYFANFFSPYDNPERRGWILDEAVRTPSHVTSSIWEEAVSWNEADVLERCRVPLLYLDAGTPNADLARAVNLQPDLVIGRTVGSGHFSQLEVPEQINSMLERFIAKMA